MLHDVIATNLKVTPIYGGLRQFYVVRVRITSKHSLDCSESEFTHIIAVNKHCHVSHSSDIDKKARKKLIIASILCVVFMLGEVAGKSL